MQGFGNAGQHCARLLHADGYKVVAISDSRGGIFCEGGIDIPAAIHHKHETGSLPEPAGSKKLDSGELLALDVHVLVPAALEDQIREDNVGDVKAKVVLELANGPTTGAADDALHARDVLVIPDVLANAGGVTVSWFEWLQNRAGSYWRLREVHDKLRDVMRAQFAAVHERMKHLKTSMRTAAYAVALERLSGALTATGTVDDFRR